MQLASTMTYAARLDKRVASADDEHICRHYRVAFAAMPPRAKLRKTPVTGQGMAHFTRARCS